MLNLIKKNVRIWAVALLFMGLCSACTEDMALDEAIENLKEVPVLDTEDPVDEEKNIPGG